jgi:hypothetical protein
MTLETAVNTKIAVFWVVAPCSLAIALMWEAARTTETLVNYYQTPRCYNPEDSNLHTHRRENLKSYSAVNTAKCHIISSFKNYPFLSVGGKRSICVALRHFQLILMMQDIINISTDTLIASGINKT